MNLEYRHLRWLSLIWDTELTTKAKVTAAALAEHMNANHDIAWPSQERLARMTSQSRKTIERAVSELEQAGWLAIERGGINKGTSKYLTVFPRSVERLLKTQSPATCVPESQACVTESRVLASQSRINQSIESANKNRYVHSDSKSFTEFYSAYPRKAKKPDAEKAWKKLKDSEKDAAIADCKTRYTSTEKQFIPYPATYLRAKSWEDEPLPADKKTNGAEEPYGFGGL